jgi:hypothetical protein
MQGSLVLFMILLFTLTVSVYFGKLSMDLTEKMTINDPTGKLDASLLAANLMSQQQQQISPTVAPTMAPNAVPTMGPTMAPNAVPTMAPNAVPNALLTNTLPTMAPLYALPSGTGYNTGYSVVNNSAVQTMPDPNPVSEYYNWLAFWNTVANSNDQAAMIQSSNYIPKTSAVPHSCTQCMQGSENVSGLGSICTNCGGNGGSGTSSKYKNRFSDFLSTYGAGYRGDGKWYGYRGNSGSSDSNDDDPSLGKLVQGAGSGLVDLTKTTLKETTSLARDAGSGAAGFLKDTGSGATGLLKDTGSGVKDFIGDIGSGAADLLKRNPAQVQSPTATTQSSGSGSGSSAGQNVYQSGYFSTGTYTLPNNPLGLQGIDPYSYNGALVSKGGNYMPVTSDFSSFRK